MIKLQSISNYDVFEQLWCMHVYTMDDFGSFCPKGIETSWDLSTILSGQKSPKPAIVVLGTKNYTFASQFQVKQRYNKTGFQLTT